MEEFGERAEAETFRPPNPSSLKAGDLPAPGGRGPCENHPGFRSLLHRVLLQVPTPSSCGFFTSGLLLWQEGGKAPCCSHALGSSRSCESYCRHVDIQLYALAFLLLTYIFVSSILDCWSFLDVGRKLVRIRDKHLAPVLGWLWNHGFFRAGKVKIEPGSSLVCLLLLSRFSCVQLCAIP